MSNLRELLKDKTLPVKVQHTWSCRVFDVIFIGEQIAVGRNTFGGEYPIEARDEYTIIEQPRPKKKMYAYLRQSFDEYRMEPVYFVKEKPPEVVSTTFYRAPSLDCEVES